MTKDQAINSSTVQLAVMDAFNSQIDALRLRGFEKIADEIDYEFFYDPGWAIRTAKSYATLPDDELQRITEKMSEAEKEYCE